MKCDRCGLVTEWMIPLVQERSESLVGESGPTVTEESVRWCVRCVMDLV
ncbi:MAG: hypothetical protein ACREJ6_14340 [Candidatus Methylomirabilis sp.]